MGWQPLYIQRLAAVRGRLAETVRGRIGPALLGGNPPVNPADLKQVATPGPAMTAIDIPVITARPTQEGHTYRRSAVAVAVLGGSQHPVHPSLVWWVLLYALWMLARYEPSSWQAISTFAPALPGPGSSSFRTEPSTRFPTCSLAHSRTWDVEGASGTLSSHFAGGTPVDGPRRSAAQIVHQSLRLTL